MKMHPKSIRFSIAVSVLLSALLLASCGDDDFTPIARPSADQDEELSSSSRGSSSSSWKDPFNPDIDYGTMTDPRDGKTYRTVEIEGTTWMAENLNYSGNNVGVAVCYNNSDSLCALFGRLYSRDAAMDDSRCEYQSGCDLGDGPIQGICPDGWHIPTLEEMDNLVNFVGTDVSRYKSMGSTWDYGEGVDTYGLSFLGAGNWDDKDGFDGLHRFEVVWAYWPNEYQHYLLLIGGSPAPVRTMVYGEFEKYNSVRCIKDE